MASDASSGGSWYTIATGPGCGALRQGVAVSSQLITTWTRCLAAQPGTPGVARLVCSSVPPLLALTAIWRMHVCTLCPQVFAREGWDRLLEGLLNTTEGGGPVHHLDEYAVMDNPILGVHGGWKVGDTGLGEACHICACSTAVLLVLMAWQACVHCALPAGVVRQVCQCLRQNHCNPLLMLPLA